MLSFPGGRVDDVRTSHTVRTCSSYCPQTDASFEVAALRETHEEVGIAPDQVELLGQFGPPVLSLGGLRVYAYVVSLRHKLLSVRSAQKMNPGIPTCKCCCTLGCR